MDTSFQRVRLLAVVVSLLLCVSLRSEAAIVYTQDPTYPGSFTAWTSSAATGSAVNPAWSTFDDFQIANGATIEKIAWQGFYLGESSNLPNTTQWQLTIYTSKTINGVPQPDVVKFSQSVTGSNVVLSPQGFALVDTGDGLAEVLVYDFYVILDTPFSAQPDMPYWLLIQSRSTTNDPVWAWMSGSPGNRTCLQQSGSSGLFQRSGDRAFALYNDKLIMPGGAQLDAPRPKHGLDVSGGGFIAAPPYAFTTIDVPGAVSTMVNGNSTHAIAGEYSDADGTPHGFLWNKKELIPIDIPGADMTTVNGINASGQIAGNLADASGFQGFVRIKDVDTALSPPDALWTQAYALNARCSVVGDYADPSSNHHGFHWNAGVYTTIDHPDAAAPWGTAARGINDLEEIVGSYIDIEGNCRGFLLSQGVYTTLDVPGAMYTVARAINNRGDIAGFYLGGDSRTRGFVLSKGSYVTVDVPDADWTELYSINAQGEVVGAYEDATGVHGLCGTPNR